MTRVGRVATFCVRETRFIEVSLSLCEMVQYKIAVIGVSGVGKSALTSMVVDGDFERPYEPNLVYTDRREMSVDGELCDLDILDTAGQEEFLALRFEYMRTSEGFLCVYSITDRSSFEEITAYHAQVDRKSTRLNSSHRNTSRMPSSA